MAQIDSSIARGNFQQMPQQDPMNMLAQLLAFQNGMQRNKLMEMQMAHEQTMQPYQIEKLKAEAAAIPELANTRRAQQAKAQQDLADAQSQAAGRNRLMQLMQTGGYDAAAMGHDPNVPTRVMMDENAAREAALAHMQSGSKEPFRAVSPNPMELRAAAMQANPKEGAESLFKMLNGSTSAATSPLSKLIAERDRLPPGDPRRSVYDDAITKASTHQAPVNVYNGGLQPGVDAQGRPVFVQGSGRADVPPRVVDPEIATPPPTVGSLKVGLLGANESAQLNRVLMGGNQVAKALGNIVNIPITSSSGIFGGRGQGPSLFEAGKESLTNTMTTQEVQSYNTLTAGIRRSLAAIESAGLSPTNSLMHMMDAVTLKQGDTNFTKILKLAETRQIVEAGYEVVLSNPRVSESQKKQAQKALDDIREHVPFTPLQVLQLDTLQQTDPKATMKDVMKENTGNAPKAALDYLKANPHTKDAFKAKYGYLP